MDGNTLQQIKEEFDVFISYAHLDNKPVQDKGWVSRFDELLDNFLGVELGRTPRIWRDPEMYINHYIWDEIKQKLLNSLALVSILSPSYINSEWCRKELKTFRQEKNTRFGNKSSIFKVVKKPIKPDIIPQDFRDLFNEILDIKFYEESEKSDKSEPFIVEFGDKSEQRFYQRVYDLAFEIARFIDEMNAKKPAPPVISNIASPLIQTIAAVAPVPKLYDGKTIYLPEPSDDLLEEYLKIRRELVKCGAKVLPASDFLKSSNIDEYTPAVRENVNNCRLVIHLVGEEYEESLDTNSIAHLKTEISVASERDGQPDFKRLIWMPKGIQDKNLPYQDFIRQLLAPATSNVDVLQNSLEEFKTRIQDVLTDKPKPAVQSLPKTAKPYVYVLYDKSDIDNVTSLEKHLHEKGEVKIMRSREYMSYATQAEIIEEHNNFLINTDRVLIYWNTPRVSWLRAKLREMDKIKASGRDEDFQAVYIFLAGNETEDKQIFEEDGVTIINGFNGFDNLDQAVS
jgi:hypothetical protein